MTVALTDGLREYMARDWTITGYPPTPAGR